MNINIITKKANGGFVSYIENIDENVCTGHGNNELEAIKSIVEVYADLYKVYYNDAFDKYAIWENDVIIELRNGNKYRLRDDAGVLVKRKTDSKNCVKNLWKSSFDKYLYYGVSAEHDVVKIFDEDNNLLAERNCYNELGHTNFIRM